MVTFFTDTTTFRMGVTPNTQHHAPRIFAPTVLYLPLLQPISHGANFSFAAIEGADEDGMTVLEWQHHSSSVLRMSSDGTMTMFPMATLAGQNQPWPSTSAPVWPDWFKWFMWKVRVIAVDRATVPPVTTTLTMTAKLCTGTPFLYVPITTTDEGITIRGPGQTQTVYVKNWGPSCIDNATRTRLENFNHTQAACMDFGKTWISPHYFTRAEKLVECYTDQPCEFKVHSVKLDFVPFVVVRCKWSDKFVTGAERYCHDLVKTGVGVTHDAFHITYTGEHTSERRAAANPGTMLIKPFQGRATRKNPYAFDIGRREVFCVTSMANDTGTAGCPSLPHCVTVFVKEAGYGSGSGSGIEFGGGSGGISLLQTNSSSDVEEAGAPARCSPGYYTIERVCECKELNCSTWMMLHNDIPEIQNSTDIRFSCTRCPAGHSCESNGENIHI
jgi:hypothetical protein